MTNVPCTASDPALASMSIKLPMSLPCVVHLYLNCGADAATTIVMMPVLDWLSVTPVVYADPVLALINEIG